MNLFPTYSQDRLLKYLEPHERKYVVANTHARKLKRGEVLIRQGEQDNTMFLIESGELDILVEGADGAHILTTLKAGDVLGEMAFLTEQPRSATVRARVASTVRAFDQNNLRFIAAEAPEILGKIALAICEILSERLYQTLNTLPMLIEGVGHLKAEWTHDGVTGKKKEERYVTE